MNIPAALLAPAASISAISGCRPIRGPMDFSAWFEVCNGRALAHLRRPPQHAPDRPHLPSPAAAGACWPCLRSVRSALRAFQARIKRFVVRADGVNRRARARGARPAFCRRKAEGDGRQDFRTRPKARPVDSRARADVRPGRIRAAEGQCEPEARPRGFTDGQGQRPRPAEWLCDWDGCDQAFRYLRFGARRRISWRSRLKAASSSEGSTPSDAITSSTRGSDRTSVRVGSEKHSSMRILLVASGRTPPERDRSDRGQRRRDCLPAACGPKAVPSTSITSTSVVPRKART